ncbi:hypothetical protein F2Q70_00000372 [Brassica cretica]|uniref:Uncharacterized protein n=1 Tax=Brassica cretica TaxID=69181 RepID=A0A8S9J372_BRACR|nr:hypothetical protein F2Q70_00000372 [Brassica cretica]
MNNKDGSEKSVKQIINEDIAVKEVTLDEKVENGKEKDEKTEGSADLKKKASGEQGKQKEREIEEGEVVEKWLDVTPEKASKSSNTLKFGQVGILTPSRFSSLLDVDEKGNSIEIEEIISIEEELVEGEKEGNDKEEKVEEIEKNDDVEEKSVEGKYIEEKEKGGIAEGSLIQGIAGLQNTQEH